MDGKRDLGADQTDARPVDLAQVTGLRGSEQPVSIVKSAGLKARPRRRQRPARPERWLLRQSHRSLKECSGSGEMPRAAVLVAFSVGCLSQEQMGPSPLVNRRCAVHGRTYERMPEEHT